jgi:aminotransferase
MRESYISRRVAGLKPSGIRKFFDIAATMKDVISLGIGEPDFTTPDKILEVGVASLRRGDTHYTSNAGIFELRKALSEHIERLYGVHYDPATEIVITVGGSEALYLAATALLDTGDEMIIPTPCFVSYQAQAVLAGGVAVEIPGRMEENFDLNINELAGAINSRSKAILLGFPSNPTGAVASRERIVISDEIYDRLVYDVPHVCFPALPGMRKRTLLLGGFSKDYAMTGWRIGYACGPAELIKGLVRIHQFAVMSAPTIAQWAALEAILHGEEDVERMRVEYNRRRRLLVDGLNQIGLPTFEPHGAFYAFPKVSASGLDDDTFCNRLLQEEHVAIVPGNSFGLGGEGFARACYATAYNQLEEALKRIERFVNRL